MDDHHRGSVPEAQCITARLRLRLIALSLLFVMVVIVGTLQWRRVQMRQREAVARAMLKNHLGLPRDLDDTSDDSSLTIQTLSFIRGDMLVEWWPPALETNPVNRIPLRWTVNVLTHQVYRWQSFASSCGERFTLQGW